MQRIRVPRPSVPLVVSSLALAVALSGTGVAVAAVVIPKNSVGSAQLKKSAVTSSKLKAAAVTGSKVADRSLTGADVKDGSLLAGDLKAGQFRQGARAYGTVGLTALTEPEPPPPPAVSFRGGHPGLVSVVRKAMGVYCVTPAAGVPTVHSHAQVTAGVEGNVTSAVVRVADVAASCPTSTIEVRTTAWTGSVFAPNDGVGFTILVP